MDSLEGSVTGGGPGAQDASNQGQGNSNTDSGGGNLSGSSPGMSFLEPSPVFSPAANTAIYTGSAAMLGAFLAGPGGAVAFGFATLAARNGAFSFAPSNQPVGAAMPFGLGIQPNYVAPSTDSGGGGG